MKFPDDPNARFFGLRIVEESEEREESEASAESEAREDGEEQGGMLTSRKELPIARCRADIDFIVDVASRLFPPPACAECASCFSRYKSAIPFAAVVANFAYLPASVLFNRFVYVFPPPSLEITQLADALCLYDPACSYLPIRLHLREVRDLAEKLPLLLLLVIALKWAREIAMVHGRLGAKGRVGEQKSSKGRRAGSGRNGVGKEEEGEEENEEDVWKAWEEVRSWCATAVMAWPASVRDGRKWYDPASISAGLSLDCKGSTEPQREEVTGQMMIDMFRAATQTRLCADLDGQDGEGKGKKEVPAYLKPWPGGTNLLACLREMLLGEPCYRPASPAASSTHPTVKAIAAVPNHASAQASVSKASGHAAYEGYPCGAEGCDRVGGGGVKLRNCGGCGKVTYCSRECQKTHWPSHKLTCPCKTSGKKSGTNSGKVSGKVREQGQQRAQRNRGTVEANSWCRSQ
ncbi:unnamed protein product [Closterium sp. NIES-64]|nr:unnamed protein product [Closterium sp. NIES-64]